MNIPQSIFDKLGRNLHRHSGPLAIIWRRIQTVFPDFVVKDDFNPRVFTHDNFDVLQIGPDHPARKPSDTFYYSETECLRTHTSVHQVPMIKEGHTKFIVCGDVYRKDSIDQYHYPIFHQVEGVKLFPPDTPLENIIIDLKSTLENLIQSLFNEVTVFKWRDYYKFPFTTPSFELDMKYKGDMVEILGCGVIRPEILNQANTKQKGWAFGIGLERVAMILFKIPDIRLFWTDDERFHQQFSGDSTIIVVFKPYSHQPICYKDIAMWVDMDLKSFKREFHSLVREIGGDLVESISTQDKFEHPKTGRASRCFRINYRHTDRSLTNEEVNKIQDQVIEAVNEKLNIVIR